VPEPPCSDEGGETARFGTTPLDNLDGVFVVSGPSNNTIEENVIAASVNNGVALFVGARMNLVGNNTIGTDITGSVALGNQTGVFVGSGSDNNTIGAGTSVF